MTKLSRFWNKVCEPHRHIISSMDPQKIQRLTTRANKFLFDNLNKDQVQHSIEWGCGGGLIARELNRFSDVYLIDISEESLNTAKNLVNHTGYALLSEDLSEFNYTGPKPDLINATDVVHHFPSYQYFLDVLDIWFDLAPLYITVHTKSCVEDYLYLDNYFDHGNYIRGFKINPGYLNSSMNQNNYDLIKQTVLNEKGMAWSVFERR